MSLELAQTFPLCSERAGRDAVEEFWEGDAG